MGATDVLTALRGMGLTLSAGTGNIKVEPRAAITEEARKLIRAHKAELLAVLNAKDGPDRTNFADGVSRVWLVEYPDGSMIETYIVLADGTFPRRAEVLQDYPGAIAARPTPKRIPTASMTAEEEAAIRAWLTHIGETDPTIIAEVLNNCATDAEARDYYVQRAEEVPPKTGKEIER